MRSVENQVNVIDSQRLQCTEHAAGMTEDRITKAVLEGHPYGVQALGQTKEKTEG